MKYDGIVIYSDLDGTMLDDRRMLSKENAEAVSYFVINGGSFGVATGRMERTTMFNFPELDINIPSIFFNGALVYDLKAKEVLLSRFMPEGLEPLLKDFLRRYPTTSVEINTVGNAFVFNRNDIIRIQLAREGLEGLDASWDEIPKNWAKVLFVDDHFVLERIKAELEGLLRSDINIVFSENELLDVMASEVSKGSALSYLKNINKGKWKLVAAVGDNDNDADMIREADVGIAVANARPSVIKAAKHVIGNNTVPCIPKVLEIIENYL